MSIAISEVTSNRPYGHNGQRKVGVSHTDHLGVVHKRLPVIISSNFVDEAEKQTYLSNAATAYENNLDNNEQTDSVNSVDIVDYILFPKHSTAKKIAKYLVRLIIREKDVVLVIKLKPFILYLNANFSDIQLINLLDITQTQLNRLRARIKDIYSAPVQSKSLEDILTEFNDSSGEF